MDVPHRRIMIIVLLAITIVPTGAAQQSSRGADATLLAWSEAIRHWRKEADSAAVRLSSGVLFDCVAHRPRRDIAFDIDHQAVAGNESCRVQKHAQCLEQAERAFAEAVQRDPGLLEARLRLGGARSERDPDEGLSDLTEVYSSDRAPTEMRYLAAVFIGKSEWARHKAAKASEWFSNASRLNPTWTVAPLLLQASVATPTPLFGGSQPHSMDPWYAFRCGILTPAVGDATKERIQKERGK